MRRKRRRRRLLERLHDGLGEVGRRVLAAHVRGADLHEEEVRGVSSWGRSRGDEEEARAHLARLDDAVRRRGDVVGVRVEAEVTEL